MKPSADWKIFFIYLSYVYIKSFVAKKKYHNGRITKYKYTNKKKKKKWSVNSNEKESPERIENMSAPRMA